MPIRKELRAFYGREWCAITRPRILRRAGGRFTKDGRYLGGFYRGFVYDQRGSAVAFVHGASGGPLRPATKLVPLAPVLRLPRYGHPPRLVPARQKACREWSSESFDAFLDGEDDTEDFAYNGGRRRDGAGL